VGLDDLIRWLRDEHNGIHDLIDQLRQTAAKPPRGDRRNWVRELNEHYGAFAASLRERMARQEQRGYLQPVREIRPALSGQVDLLEHEREELKRLVDNLERAVQKLTPSDNLLLRDCCKRIECLLGWFERHQEHENHLVLYVFAQAAAEKKTSVEAEPRA
jgi:hemerythrin-like domain-containing protein